MEVEDQDISSEEEEETTAIVEESDNDEEEEASAFTIKLDDEEEEDAEGKDKDKDKDKDKAKSKDKDDEPDEKDKQIAELTKKLEKAEKDKRKAFYEARQVKKDPEKQGEQLSSAQLRQILADNPDNPETLMNIIDYVAEQKARGISTETVNAVEVNRKKGELDDLLTERYPDIHVEGSDIRIEVDKAKKTFNLETHPFGDFFAVASRVLEDLPDLLKNAFEQGKGKSGTEAEDKRKKDINAKKLPASKKRSIIGEGLTGTQAEAAKQMGLKGNALKTYKQLVGKNPRVVSVEDK